MGARYRAVMVLFTILGLLVTLLLFASLVNVPKSSGLTTSNRANSEGTPASPSLAPQMSANDPIELFSFNGLLDSLVPNTPVPSQVISNNGTIINIITMINGTMITDTIINGTIINGTISNGKPEPQDSVPEGMMWIEPSALAFLGVNGSVGTRFNVTVWLCMAKSIFSYEVALHYDRNVLQCTNAGYTGENSSQYFFGHVSDMPPIRIDTGFLGNGSVLAGEALYGNDAILGPRNASLIWIEFEILNAQSGETIAGRLDLSTEYPAETFVLDNNLDTVPFTPTDATFTFTP